MATIKSFTDLEQSKKLAEILPLESADMYYEWTNKKVHFKDDKYNGMGISCWSLAALLDILPDRTCVFKKTYKDGRVKYQGVMEGNKELILKDNSVDACYELILKLHELKML